MMRKSLKKIIMETEVNYENEMRRVECIFSKARIVEHFLFGKYGTPIINRMSMEKYINDFLFIEYEQAGTFISVGDMRQELKITREDFKENSKEKLLLYFEFIGNMVLLLSRKLIGADRYNKKSIKKLLDNIQIVLDKLNYSMIIVNNYCYIIEKDSNITAVTELYSELNKPVIEYRRFDLKGNLEAKRNILQTLSLKIESIEQKLKSTTYHPIAKDLGNLYNNLHIRHNNLDENLKNNIIDMGEDELENWYDLTFDTTLTALMICKYLEHKTRINSLTKFYKNIH